jgi:hypothetical protein
MEYDDKRHMAITQAFLKQLEGGSNDTKITRQ